MKALNKILVEKLFKNGFTLVDNRPREVYFRHTSKDGSIIDISDPSGKNLPKTANDPVMITVYSHGEKLMEIHCRSLVSFMEWGDKI